MKNKLNKEKIIFFNFYLLTLMLFLGCSSSDEVDVNPSSLTYDNEIYNP